MKDLGHAKNVDLDPKKLKRSTRAVIKHRAYILVVRVAIPIVLDLINVNVLKIERKNSMIEVEREIDIDQDTTETIEIKKTLKIDIKTYRIFQLNQCLQHLMICLWR